MGDTDNSEKINSFTSELAALLNRYSRESNTPDFVLRDFIVSSLHALDAAILHNLTTESDSVAPTVRPERICQKNKNS